MEVLAACDDDKEAPAAIARLPVMVVDECIVVLLIRRAPPPSRLSPIYANNVPCITRGEGYYKVEENQGRKGAHEAMGERDSRGPYLQLSRKLRALPCRRQVGRQDIAHRNRPKSAAGMLGVDADEDERSENEVRAAGQLEQIQCAAQRQSAALHLG